MGFVLDCDPTDRKINWVVSYVGFIYFFYRVLCMRAFMNPLDELLAPYNEFYHPTVMHLSYFVALLMSLSMICSFRVKILNAVSVLMLPTTIITIPFVDVAALIDPELVIFAGSQIGDLIWWNYIALHWPAFFLGLYFVFTHNYTLSKASVWMAFFILIGWFFSLDNWVNGLIDGTQYAIVMCVALTVCLIIVNFLVLKNVDSGDPLIAPVVKIKKFRLIKV